MSSAALIAALLALDPHGFGGVWLRGAPCPARESWLNGLRASLPAFAPFRRLPAGVPDSRLLGGLDLAATLSAGRPVLERGLVAEANGGVLAAAMAERLPPSMAGRLAAALDRGEVAVEREGATRVDEARFGLVLLDEGIGEEQPPPALTERMAFRLELDGVDPVEALGGDVEVARRLFASVTLPGDAEEALCAAAAALGIESLRAPLFALRAARGIAALGGREAATAEDLEAAARLVFAHRVTRLPESGESQAGAEEDAPPESGQPEQEGEAQPLEEAVQDAVRAALPPEVLAQIAAGNRVSRGKLVEGRAGAMARGAQRGRPIGTRAGLPRDGARLALVETLRAAAPWQRLRPRRPGALVAVRPQDLRVLRLLHRKGTTAIFLVDASGSAALHRLAEAKGAVELLLAECYARRDQVAVIGFRGQVSELLLPPTSSLTRAKRSLAGLPGGGGTPLAAAVEAGAALAAQVAKAGRSPLLVLLTDGRANVARGGATGRAPGEADALAAARLVRAAQWPALVIDTSPRPSPQALRLAQEMDARYLPLPHADASALSGVIKAAA